MLWLLNWVGKMVYPDLLKAEPTNIHVKAEEIGTAFSQKLSNLFGCVLGVFCFGFF